MSAQCQVARLGLRDYLTCSYKESGGLQCERQDFHGDTGHYISDHTIAHSLAGNGWDCSSFEDRPVIGPRRRELLEQIELLNKELRELTH